MKKAFLIARVSTEEQESALGGQINRLLDYAQKQNYEYELFQISESAYKGSREQFKNILTQIKVYSDCSVVVFDKIDRYTRDFTQQESADLVRLVKNGKIELHFPSDNLSLYKGSPATDLFRLGMGALLAQYYSDSISDNVKRKNEQKLRAGEWTGPAPFGYINSVNHKGNKWVDVDSSKSEIVRRIYELYGSEIQSLQTVRKKIIEEFGVKFAVSQLDKILKNPFYFGQMRIKGKLYPHYYKKIITKEFFVKAESARNGHKKKKQIWAGLPYAFRGLINCAECGCSVTFESKKAGKYVYGHCTQYKSKHNAQYVLESQIENQLSKAFEEVSITEKDYIKVTKELNLACEQRINNEKESRIRVESEILKYKTRIHKMYDDVLDERISRDIYDKKAEEYHKQIEKLQNHSENFELVIKQELRSVNNLLSLAKEAPQLFKKANFEQKRELVNLVLSNLELHGKELRWKLKKPFELMAFCSKSGNWYPGRDSNPRPVG